MDKSVLVHKVDTGDCLNEEPECFVLRQSLPLRNLQEQVSLGDVLHD